MSLKPNFHPEKTMFIILLLIVFTKSECVDSRKGPPSKNDSNLLYEDTLLLYHSSSGIERTKVNVRYLGSENVYELNSFVTIYIPNVHIDCHCSCFDDVHKINEETSCRRNIPCSLPNNNTIFCLHYKDWRNNPLLCHQRYLLCCRILSPTITALKPFKAFKMKYDNTLLHLQVILQPPGDRTRIYNITVRDNLKNILINTEYAELHVVYGPSVPLIPEGRYFVENSFTEMLLSETMNEEGEYDMKKVNWFQFESGHDFLEEKLTYLMKNLRVNVSNCQTDLTEYTWDLKATYNKETESLEYLPKTVRTVSTLHKDTVGKVSLNFVDHTVRIGHLRPPSVNVSISRFSFSPFFFHCSIEERKLNLRIVNGDGSFHVEITSPLWTDVLSFEMTRSQELVTELPDLNYQSCWVCLYQNEEQRCQIPSLKQCIIKSRASLTEEQPSLIQSITQSNPSSTERPVQPVDDIGSRTPVHNVAVIYTVILIPFLLLISTVVWTLY